MIMRKQKVLIVHNYYQVPGGEDTVVANEKQMLENHGHEVVLYTKSNDELDNLNLICKLLLPLNIVFNIKVYREIKCLIKNEKIDIVHVHNTLMMISPSVYYAAKSCNVPVVQTIHNFRFLCPGAAFYRDGHICEDCINKGLWYAVKYNCYRNNKIQTLACVINMKFHQITGIYRKIYYICLTDFNKEKFLKLKQINADKVFVKPNFVESTGVFIPEEQRKNQFIFAGRLDKLKGIDICFEAWKKMGETAPKLIVCGTGPMEKWCKEFVSKNDINIELKGLISNRKVLKLIANSRALILPTQWYEGFPMSIVEAYSVGTPVICSNFGNAGVIVQEGVTGCKFKSNSAEELITAVRRCIGMCKSTLDIYQKQYTEIINYEILANIYKKV